MALLTRQLLREFSEGQEEDIQLWARKFLATQAPVVNSFTQVYPYVANDLASLTFKSHVPPAEWTKRNIPLDVYKYLLPKKDEEFKGGGIYVDFKRHLADIGAPLNDMPLLFFLQGTKNRNLRSLIEEQYPSWTVRKREDLVQAILSFEPHRFDNPNHIANDVGLAIIGLDLKDIDSLYMVSEPVCIVGDDLTLEDDLVMTNVLPLSQPVADTERLTEHEKRLQYNPVIINYGKNTGLSSQFSSKIKMKQILASLLTSDYAVASHLLGKRQKALGSVLSTDVTKDDWNGLLQVATNIDTSFMTNMPAATYFYNLLGTCIPKEELSQMTQKDLLQHLITAYMPNYEELWFGNGMSGPEKRAIEKYLKRYPEIDRTILTKLLE